MKDIKLAYFNLYITLKDLAKNAVFIVLAVLIGFFGCKTYCDYMKDDTYTSKMIVSINLSGYTVNSTSTSLTRTVAIADILSNVFQSNALRESVEQSLNEPLTSEIISWQLDKTNLVEVEVSDKDPTKAYKTLAEIEQTYPSVTDLSFNNVIITTVENPSVPTTVLSKQSNLIMELIYGLVFGLVATLLIVIFSYFRDTVKNSSDINDMLELKLFGVVYREKLPKLKNMPNREANGLMITNHNTTYSFTQSFRKMAIKLESLKRTKKINSILVTSVFENEGKTTVSTNVAVALAQENNRVVIVDADLKKPSVKNCFENLPSDGSKDFGAYLNGDKDLSSCIVYDENTGVSVLSSVKSYHDSSELLSSDQFKAAISELEENFDFVIIDTPPSGLTADAEIAMAVASSALLVVRQDYTDVPAINDYIENINPDHIIGCVFNNVEAFKSRIRSEDFV